jgi:hypothetical protein
MAIKIRHILLGALLMISIAIVINVFYKTTKSGYKNNTTTNKEPIYCVMITGKDKSRWNFAHIAIDNFKRQSHPNKRLIIINEGASLMGTGMEVMVDNILEIKLNDREEKGITLGDMRNIAFEFIPDGAIWTLWDDDDWRSDDYLDYLYTNLQDKDYDYVLFTKRLEHNLNTGFTWIMELKSGFVILFGRKQASGKCRYESKDVNEDVLLKKHIIDNLKFKLIENNDPKIYIRMVHKTNTSLLVNQNKSLVKDTSQNKVYYEYDASDGDVQYVKNIVDEKYNLYN